MPQLLYESIQKPSGKLSWILGILSGLLGVLWIALYVVGSAMINYGDGAGGPAAKIGFEECLPIAFCFLVAFSCLTFVRGTAFLVTGILLNGIFVFLMYQLFTTKLKMPNAWVIETVLALPFLGMETGWIFICRQRYRRNEA